MDTSLVLIPVLLGVGVFVGLLAGMLGIGGGMTIVPLLTFVFGRLAFPAEHVIHMAVATSLASIAFTAIASVRAHHARGAVLWPVVRSIAPGMLAGALVGPLLVAAMSGRVLALVCACFAYFGATQLLLDRKPKPTRELPGNAARFAFGAVNGALASMVGVGGAFLLIPFLTWCNVRMHHTVAISAALAVPVALAGTIGYVIAGTNATGMPDYSVGFIYLPALFAIVVPSMLVAPHGARLAHAMSTRSLKRAFALLLYALGTYMLAQALPLLRGPDV